MSNDYYVVSGDSLREIADAIRTKSGTSAQLEFPDEWTDTIDDIQTGGGGTVGSVWQDINGYVHLSSESGGGGGGDTPIPDDGKTRIFIHIADDTPDNRLTFYLRFTASVANNTTVDWGDGTTETKGSITAANYSHKYSQGGDYVITMTVNTGTISFEGTSGSTGQSIYGYRGTSSPYYINRSRIERIIFGDDVTAVGDYTCYDCVGLKSVTFLNKDTTIGQYVFYGCYALSSINIPDDITAINQYIFNACYALTQLTIPEDVTSIGANAFYNCRAMSEYHFKPTTPPALANSNAFTGIYSDCVIYVPYSANHSILETYKTATNWSGQASKMQEEPQS